MLKMPWNDAQHFYFTLIKTIKKNLIDKNFIYKFSKICIFSTKSPLPYPMLGALNDEIAQGGLCEDKDG